MEHRLLAIYLNDHLAGSTFGVELSRRAKRNNEGNDYGAFATELSREIAEDRQTLLSVMGRLGIRPSRPKTGLSWLAEKIGRFKLNGRLLAYSPLSRLLELEFLLLGITGKLALWRLLEQLASTDPRLAGVDFAALTERAERQREAVEQHRLRAGAEAS